MTSGLLNPGSALGRVGKSCPAPRLVKLADCVDLLSGLAFKSQEFTNDPHDVALVKGENVSQGRVLWDISKRWPLADWRKYEKFQLAAGDVVIAMDRPWVPAGLKWCFIRDHDPKALLVQRCCRLRANPRLMDQTFLRCVIGGPGFESYIKPITTGVNIPHVSGRQILDYSFPLPDLPTQRKIAGILSAYDDLIENNLRRIKILKEMAQSLYREWFVHFRFPGHESVPLVESPIGLIPAGWDPGRVDDIVFLQRGFDITKKEQKDGPYPVVSSSGTSSFHADFKVAGPGVVIGRKGALGTVHFVESDFWPHDTTLWVKEFRRGSALNAFYLLRELDLGRFDTGAAVPTLNRNNVHCLPVSVPPKDLLCKFNEFAVGVHEQVRTLRRSNDTLRQTRELLMPQLLRGGCI